VARQKLSRPQKRYNYTLAVGAVLVVVFLVIASPRVQFQGSDVPVLVVALLVTAFLFGLGQMVVGLSRRRRYLRSLEDDERVSGAGE
jgi:hypothetical protein